ncbi:hypothetical protein N1027_11855 [Herbiconiux sp. CPCC 205763]|uniref:Major facilitator superfamily (MFS) profile domain-containing protein n=1 Tax=Herbiconiux aconitum TaxID=2970913 RepID=A0ABT2GRI6_9MICO|nr:hypothetical protein [Herbiconiux aconitum]MCS5718829.1 hypothetical protein [Herbiconiux aconitum]
MATGQTPEPYARFIWRYAMASGFAGFALFLATMSSDDWHWMGFVLPIAMFVGLLGWLVGFAAGVVVNSAALFFARASKVEPRRSIWATVVVGASSGLSGLLLAVGFSGFQHVSLGWPAVIIAAMFAVLSVLLWRIGEPAGSPSVPAEARD